MRNPILQVLSIKPFFYLLVSEFFSQVSMNLLNFILLLVVFSLSKSNTAVSGVVLSFTLPSLFLGIIAGVYVDRWNKRSVLVWTNVLRAIAVIPIVFLSDNLLIIYSLSFVVSLITQFFIPAETPIIPLLVKRELLLSANALFGVGIFGSMIIAYALSGPLLLFLGIERVLLLLVLFFIFSAFFAFLIKIKFKDRHERERRSFRTELYEALKIILTSRNVYRSIIVLTLVQTLILIVAVIGPGYAQNVLKIRVEEFPIIFVTPAVIGMAVGAILLGNFPHKFSKSAIRRLGLFIIGLIFVIFPHGPLLASIQIPNLLSFSMLGVLVCLAFMLGFSLSLVFVPSNTVIQEETTDEQRGKIYGAMNTFVGAISIIPVLAVGTLSDLFGITVVLTAIGVLLIAIVASRFVPNLWNL
ncbi:MAG: MFS transporter [Candidatus Levybacteria bacterium]|nr:MFS transporter [Candidatus Levybacteria bacterium]MBI2420636.1 MFS transporter [Candidatus Levybacteria bacterium]